MRSDRKRIGQQSEEAARRVLLAQGYRIRECNFRCAVGELDIIAEHAGRLVFVEVRSHTGDAFGAPQESVGNRKQRKVARVAEVYIKQRKLQGRPVRFDVVEVLINQAGRPSSVNIIPNAFGAPPDSHI